MDGENGRAILTMREAAAFLRIGQATAYRLASLGVLPVIRVPGTAIHRVRRSALDALLQQWEQGGRRAKAAVTTQQRQGTIDHVQEHRP